MKMKNSAVILAALMLCGCGKVDDFTRREGVERGSETQPAFTFAPAADTAGNETAEETSSAESPQPEETSGAGTGSKKKAADTEAKKAADTEMTTKLPDGAPPAQTETEKPADSKPPETPTVLPEQPAKDDKQNASPKREGCYEAQKDDDEPNDPQIHSDICQPAWFADQSFGVKEGGFELARGGYKAVIRSADDLRAYMEPVYPEDFIRKYMNYRDPNTGETLDEFFDGKVLLVYTAVQSSGTAPMLQIDRYEPYDSMIKLKASWKYQPDCAYAEVMSVCLLGVPLTEGQYGGKGVLWEISEGSCGSDSYTLTDEDRNIFAQLKALDYTPVTCDGLPEYTLTAPDGSYYQLNLSGKWVWHDMKDEEAVLPDELADWFKNNGARIGMTPAEWNRGTR